MKTENIHRPKKCQYQLSNFGVEWVLIETTNICNMHCKFCPNQFIQRSKKHMNFLQFKQIIDQLAILNPSNPITLHVSGEPLLNPEIYKFIDYASEKKLRLYFYTNCSLIRDHIPNICEKNNIEALILSLQTPDEQSYLLRGYNKTFVNYIKDIYDSLEHILSTKSNEKMRIEIHLANSKHIPKFLGWQILDENENTLIIIKEIALKIKKLYFKSVGTEEINKMIDHDFKSILKHILNWHERKVWSYEVVPNIFLRLVFLDTFAAHESILPKNVVVHENLNSVITCNMIKSHLSILVDGTITSCSLDIEGELSIGNINDVSLISALQSQKRIALTQNVSKMRICRRCQGSLEVADF